jgi:hypothetical protein
MRPIFVLFAVIFLFVPLATVTSAAEPFPVPGVADKYWGLSKDGIAQELGPPDSAKVYEKWDFEAMRYRTDFEEVVYQTDFNGLPLRTTFLFSNDACWKIIATVHSMQKSDEETIRRLYEEKKAALRKTLGAPFRQSESARLGNDYTWRDGEGVSVYLYYYSGETLTGECETSLSVSNESSAYRSAPGAKLETKLPHIEPAADPETVRRVMERVTGQ